MSAQPFTWCAVDKRSMKRYQCNLEVQVRPTPETQSSAAVAQLTNVSAWGMGMVLGQRFDFGTTVAIELQSADSDQSVFVLGTVQHVSALEEGDWLLGCHLSRRLSEDEMANLIQQDNFNPESNGDGAKSEDEEFYVRCKIVQ